MLEFEDLDLYNDEALPAAEGESTQLGTYAPTQLGTYAPTQLGTYAPTQLGTYAPVS
ncbi:hypothetical protein G6W61_16605 [Streptomyces sp. KAI-26]|uniref:hypothetical protein n=1 Tax=Streptomyces sp. KAI-26 TaxID=1169747 RepID=UPI001587EF7A|nr:hypothetical protein [Streptomyces sp. KAI-26]NUV87817.1 hypothetical protein [Streptomyces sp. KAI-26]NUW20251.1 hypothetical protein [Streptomyces roseoviolaceus]